MRKPIIAGNWKMNKTAPEVQSFVEAIKGKLPKPDQVEAVIGAPNIFTQSLVDLTADLDVKVAAQNAYYEDSGSFTGETSPLALADLGTDYVIIGHSERRDIFGESDQDVNKKAKAIFKNNMLPIICLGESLETKEAGQTSDFVAGQVKAALEGLDGDQVQHLVLAYEPIWAIGTGKTASPQEANETIKVVRQTVADLYSQEVADQVRIQYGGSVKPDNIADFLATSDIDGALVGGARLEAESFLQLLGAVQ